MTVNSIRDALKMRYSGIPNKIVASLMGVHRNTISNVWRKREEYINKMKANQG